MTTAKYWESAPDQVEASPDDPPRGWGPQWLGKAATVLVLGLTCLGILALMSPELLMSPTLVTTGDLGAHIYPLHEFVTRLLPSGTVTGWSQGWFAGMPLYTFYFPLPALLVALGTPLLGFAVAVKWMLALGPLTLPLAAYAFLRAMGLSRWTATSGAVVGASYILMNTFAIFGGNLLSTFIGEFSYSISFSLSLCYLALVLHSGRKGVNGEVGAGALLALTALSHVFTTGAVVACTLPLLSEEKYRRTIIGSYFLGFLFSSFWTVPFLARLPLASGPPWIHAPTLAEMLPSELAVFLPLALVGAVWVARRCGRAALPLLALPVLALAFDLFPQTLVHRTRWLPYGFFAVHALAGLAIGAALERFAEHKSRWALVGATLGIVYFLGVNQIRDAGYVRDYVRTSLAGYEAAEGWTEYEELVSSVAELPPGRVFWETMEPSDRYGTPLALHILPYWSPDHTVLTGLWSESSLSYPFVLRASHEVGDSTVTGSSEHIDVPSLSDFDRGIDHARILGVRYFIAFSDWAQSLSAERPDMRVVVEADGWSVFELEGISLIEPVNRQPVVYEGRDFQDVATFWYDSLYAAGGFVTASGPTEWPRVEADLAGLAESEAIDVPGGAVSDVEILDESISFRTTAVGVPHLVRLSYFPNWLAVGAEGPYRVSPAFMMVVPREEEVRLAYVDSNVEWIGRALTLLGLVLALFMTARPTRRPRPVYYG